MANYNTYIEKYTLEKRIKNIKTQLSIKIRQSEKTSPISASHVLGEQWLPLNKPICREALAQVDSRAGRGGGRWGEVGGIFYKAGRKGSGKGGEGNIQTTRIQASKVEIQNCMT